MLILCNRSKQIQGCQKKKPLLQPLGRTIKKLLNPKDFGTDAHNEVQDIQEEKEHLAAYYLLT